MCTEGADLGFFGVTADLTLLDQTASNSFLSGLRTGLAVDMLSQFNISCGNATLEVWDSNTQNLTAYVCDPADFGDLVSGYGASLTLVTTPQLCCVAAGAVVANINANIPAPAYPGTTQARRLSLAQPGAAVTAGGRMGMRSHASDLARPGAAQHAASAGRSLGQASGVSHGALTLLLTTGSIDNSLVNCSSFDTSVVNMLGHQLAYDVSCLPGTVGGIIFPGVS